MIILSSIGTGKYTKTNYKFGDRSCATEFFPLALAQWFPDATLKVITTKEADEKHGSHLREAFPAVEFIEIPWNTQEDYWTIFNKIEAAIPQGEGVIFDITHGFRSLPMIYLLSLSFLSIAKQVTIEKVLYGAFEASVKDEQGNPQETPVFDLTDFVRMLDWANATHMFVKTGDARDLAPLMKAKRRYSLNTVGDNITRLSNAIACQRGGNILDSARKLRDSIQESDQGTWDAAHAPMRLLLGRIQSGFGLMAADDPSAADPKTPSNNAILTAQLQQIAWLVEQHHYPSAYSLAREWIVSVRVATAGGAIVPVSKDDREAAEQWLTDCATEWRTGRTKVLEQAWVPIYKAWVAVVDFRNDLMHFGMRADPKPYKTFENSAKTLPSLLRDAVAPLGLELHPPEADS